MSQTRMDFSKFPRRQLPKDECLFFEDEESHELFVLLTGSLGVYRDEVQVAVIDAPLSMVGEMSALTGEPRNATVRALGISNLVMVDDPDKLFVEYPRFGAKLARVLAQRLTRMNGRFVEIKHALAKMSIASVTPPESEFSAADQEALEEMEDEIETMELPGAEVAAAIARPQNPADAPASKGSASDLDRFAVTEPEFRALSDEEIAAAGPGPARETREPTAATPVAAAHPGAKTDSKSEASGPEDFGSEVMDMLSDILEWSPSGT